MWRKKVVVGLVATILVVGATTAWVAQRMAGRGQLLFSGTQLMVDLAQPDALIRSQALAALPRDLLKVPMARAVLTEELAFYYDQHEDRLGLSGAIRRIAYEHELDWSDKILATVFNEPAELAFWRDGKGALRHYALVMRRNTLAKVLQQAALVAASDSQLKLAGKIGSAGNQASVLALTINPRRTLLLITRGDAMVVLSNPGLLFDANQKPHASASAAIAGWLEHEGALSRQFRLDPHDNANPVNPAKPVKPAKHTTPAAIRPGHTLALGSTALTLGYGTLLPGIKGLRFDFHGSGQSARWSSSIWLDGTRLAATGLGDAAIWRAAPATPGACLLLPLDWHAAQQIVQDADQQPALPAIDSLAALAGLDGAVLACWYRESALMTPVFISRLRKPIANRRATLQLLADWAVKQGGEAIEGGGQDLLWQATGNGVTLAAKGEYLVFSPDRKLVQRTLETIARRRASVADQINTTDATLGVLLPRALATIFEYETMAALKQVGDPDLVAAANLHLPSRLKALAAFPALQLQLPQSGRNDWQTLAWRMEKQP